jgi:uncharacterized membrane protein YjfL (UPF0719 family)
MLNVLYHMGLMVAYTILAILLMVGGYKIFDIFTPNLNFTKELVENKNMAVAMVVSSIILGLSVIIFAVVVS